MPIYEYRCRECGAEFEQLVMRADEKVKCPKCGSSKLEKKFSTLGGVRGGSSSDDFGGSCSSGTCPTGTCGL
ncbi:zinc ribbon domain-containing protein [candidate division WOR-3 bacterium]|nr:zinc ribbon domain-containing protein [candidate division WOR-3 bacterium]